HTYIWAWVVTLRYCESATRLWFVLRNLALIHFSVLLSWGLLWYFGIRGVIRNFKLITHTRPGSTCAVLLLLWLGVTYLTIFIVWRVPGHYHLPVLPPLSILAGQAFSRFVAQQRHSPQPHWRSVRRRIVGAAAFPILVFFILAFVLRQQTLRAFPIIQGIIERTGPN